MIGYIEQHTLEAAQIVVILGYILLINPMIGDAFWKRRGYWENMVDGFKIHLGVAAAFCIVAFVGAFVASVFWLLEYYTNPL